MPSDGSSSSHTSRKLAPRPRAWCISLGLLALASVAALARWLTRSQLIYSWDTVHYLLALDRYDLTSQQPHPPGSFYYVLLARVLRSVTGDGHLALLLLSSLSGALLVVLLYHLAGALCRDDRARWLAAVLGATAPLPWFYGSLGLNYAPAGTVTTGFAWCAVLACSSRFPASSLALAGVWIGVLGGFRPTDVIFLAPAYLWALHVGRGRIANRRLQWIAVGSSLGLAGLFTLGWLLPSVVNVGGLGTYLKAIGKQDYLLQSSSVFLAGWYAFQYAWFSHQRCFESTLGAAWVLALLAVIVVRRNKLKWIAAVPGASPEEAATTRSLCVLGGLFVTPAFLFYLLVHFALPGYALTYVGFLIAVASAWITRRLALTGWYHRHAFGGLLLAVAAGNIVVFLLGWPGVGRVEHLVLSYKEIQDHDQYYRKLGRFLQSQPDSAPVTVLTSFTATDGLRVAQTLYPQYRFEQPVTHIPSLPKEVRHLPWLHLLPRDQIRDQIQQDHRTFYLICRTNLDLGYQRRLFKNAWEPVRLGPGRHHVLRLDPNFTKRLRKDASKD